MRKLLHKIKGLVKAKEVVSPGLGLRVSVIGVWDLTHHKSVSRSWAHVSHAGMWAIG